VRAIDGHRPAVAGDVPVQLVERGLVSVGEEEPDGVGEAVADDDRLISVARAWDPNAERARPPVVLVLLVYVKPVTGRVGDVAERDVELGRAALRGVVVEREVSNDAVPLASESDRQLFGDIERSAGANGEQRIEVPDANRAALCARL
jgi:hypothetical protein